MLCLALLLVGLEAAPPVHAQESAEVADGKVEAELDVSNDRDAEERLRSTYGTLEALAGVAVEVEAGVVRLSGMVDSKDARQLAGQLARQIEGITAVENQIEENRSVRRRLDLAVDRLVDRSWQMLDLLPLFLLAIGIVLLSAMVSRIAVAWDAPFRFLTENVFLQDLAKQAVRLSILVGGALIALEIMDATALVGAVLGAAGVVGLAIGFAFRDLVENYIASILLSLRRPFSPHDLVEVEGHLGTVSRLTSRATILVTPEGNHVRIPNGNVFKATIMNYTKNPKRRFSFGVAVGVDEDLVAASELGREILGSMKGVEDDPEPFSRVDELGDSSVTINFFGWVDQREADFGKVRSEAIRLVKQAFDRREIEMPEPIHRVRVETMPERKRDADSALRPPAPSEEVGDVEPESHVEEMINQERASTERDLLVEGGAPE